MTSPADATEPPKYALAWSDSAVHDALVPRPEDEPRYTYARPSLVSPLSYAYAPTTTSP